MTRQKLFKAGRSYRRRFGNNPFWTYKPGSADRLAAVDAIHEYGDAWGACKSAAINRAAGI